MEPEEFKASPDEMAKALFKAYDDKLKELEQVDGLSIQRIKDAVFAAGDKITRFDLTIRAMSSSRINERGLKLEYEKILREIKAIR